ncbi:hypothetical protein F3Y22_tig00110945pilonHSYRG00331 [Hibiscus syriacus]|uniref:Uncharacterized protein n=1 Tax=Hibiscus syriacus TaxID=106335 RepID=A0A6A2ZBC7_HIBSY|nr:hypothetical protein F3Y22_tig00110945pilonHSYRG00331 [Hibiscus syriacus]
MLGTSADGLGISRERLGEMKGCLKQQNQFLKLGQMTCVENPTRVPVGLVKRPACLELNHQTGLAVEQPNR